MHALAPLSAVTPAVFTRHTTTALSCAMPTVRMEHSHGRLSEAGASVCQCMSMIPVGDCGRSKSATNPGGASHLSALVSLPRELDHRIAVPQSTSMRLTLVVPVSFSVRDVSARVTLRCPPSNSTFPPGGSSATCFYLVWEHITSTSPLFLCSGLSRLPVFAASVSILNLSAASANCRAAFLPVATRPGGSRAAHTSMAPPTSARASSISLCSCLSAHVRHMSTSSLPIHPGGSISFRTRHCVLALNLSISTLLLFRVPVLAGGGDPGEPVTGEHAHPVPTPVIPCPTRRPTPRGPSLTPGCTHPL